MNHTELLNYLAQKYNLKSYLEIGVQNPANNFNKIRCAHKVGVDPETTAPQIYKCTSDNYFKEINKGLKFDLVFIDGLHHYDQVNRDFINAMNHLNDGGIVVIHDCLPVNEITSKVPRQSKIWHGDVYKLVLMLNNYNHLDFITYDFDNGCCVVWEDEEKRAGEYFFPEDIDWEFYQNNKHLMNIKAHL